MYLLVQRFACATLRDVYFFSLSLHALLFNNNKIASCFLLFRAIVQTWPPGPTLVPGILFEVLPETSIIDDSHLLIPIGGYYP